MYVPSTLHLGPSTQSTFKRLTNILIVYPKRHFFKIMFFQKSKKRSCDKPAHHTQGLGIPIHIKMPVVLIHMCYYTRLVLRGQFYRRRRGDRGRPPRARRGGRLHREGHRRRRGARGRPRRQGWHGLGERAGSPKCYQNELTKKSNIKTKRKSEKCLQTLLDL